VLFALAVLLFCLCPERRRRRVVDDELPRRRWPPPSSPRWLLPPPPSPSTRARPRRPDTEELDHSDWPRFELDYSYDRRARPHLGCIPVSSPSQAGGWKICPELEMGFISLALGRQERAEIRLSFRSGSD
jgi:hypothetical protein